MIGINYRNMPSKITDVTSYFYRRIKKTKTCWLWRGALHTSKKRKWIYPYGQLHVKGLPSQAHRLSWEIHYGAIPDGLFILHKCDNPPCVRPDHLKSGTAKDNNRDALVKGHSIQWKGSCKKGHPLDDVYIYPNKRQRYCRRCSRVSQLKWYHRNSARINLERRRKRTRHVVT